MLTLLKPWCGRSSRLVLWLLVWIGLASLAGCGTSPLSLLTGGGPNVAANTQIGKTNTQTLGTTNNSEQTMVRPEARKIVQSSDTNAVQSESVGKVVVNEIPPWVVLLLILGWLLPSPNEMARGIKSLLTFRKVKG